MVRVVWSLGCKLFTSELRGEEIAMSHQFVAPHTCKIEDVEMCIIGLAKDHIYTNVNAISKSFSLVFYMEEVDTNVVYVTCVRSN